MAIITDESVLRTTSSAWLDPIHGNLQVMFKELEKELKNAKYPGVGLAGIQIGWPIRIAIIRTKKLKLDIYNTEILDTKKRYVYKGEGCLSIPNNFKDTIRYKQITIKNGDGVEYKVKGFEAVVIQHEIDHWNGILFTDHIAPDLTTDNLDGGNI